MNSSTDNVEPMSAIGTKRTFSSRPPMSVFGVRAKIAFEDRADSLRRPRFRG